MLLSILWSCLSHHIKMFANKLSGLLEILLVCLNIFTLHLLMDLWQTSHMSNNEYELFSLFLVSYCYWWTSSEDLYNQGCKYKRPVNRHLRINPWIAGHLIQSFTDSFRESLILNYLIITRDNIYVSERKKNKFKTRQITGREIPGNRKFPRWHQVLSRPQIIVFLSVPNVSCGFNLWLDSVIDSKSV